MSNVLYGIGFNGFEQIPGYSDVVDEPTLIPTTEPIRSLWAGWSDIAINLYSAFGNVSLSGSIINGQVQLRSQKITAKCVVMAGNGQVCVASEGMTVYAVDKPLYSSTIHFTDLAAGRSHFLGLTPNGYLYSWGSNLHGELGRATEQSYCGTPQPVEDLAGIRFISIASGGNMSAAVSDSGGLYLFGSSPGNSIGNMLDPEPSLVSFDDDVIDVTAGDAYLAALMASGIVRARGSLGSRYYNWDALPIDDVQRICGGFATLYLVAATLQ
jgi:hypothetical protein